jgi:hypothetical protein
MRWRIVAGLFLGIWLTLLAVEFCEDAGLFDYDDPGMDQSVNATLNSLGDAIQLDDYHHHPLKIIFPVFFLGTLDPYHWPNLSFQLLIQAYRSVKASLKIITLIHVLLI